MTEPRPRTPTWHTLHGVLTQLQAAAPSPPDPALAARLDRAFSKNVPALRRVVRRELRGFSDEIVEDIVQDVLCEAWRKLPEYRPDAPLRQFLWGIARWKCVAVRRRRHDVLSDDGFLEAESEDRTALAGLAAEEREQLVQRAAAAVLDPTEQQVVHLRWGLDYPRADVAELTGLADAEEVRKVLVRCQRRLEKELLRLLADRGLGRSWLEPER